jgi:transcriptional regulator with XRE-family HTH domain
MSQPQDQKKGRQPLVNLAGKSYGEIAEASGFRKSMVHRWLTGQSMPRKANMPKLAAALGMSEKRLVNALYAGAA